MDILIHLLQCRFVVEEEDEGTVVQDGETAAEEGCRLYAAVSRSEREGEKTATVEICECMVNQFWDAEERWLWHCGGGWCRSGLELFGGLCEG